MQPIRTELQEIFRQVFSDDEIVLKEATTADDIDGWDSMMHINLIIAMERRFGVKFAAAEIAGMKRSSRFLRVLGDIANKGSLVLGLQTDILHL